MADADHLRRLIRTTQLTDREVRKVMRDAAAEADRIVRSLEGVSGPGARLRSAQAALAKMQIEVAVNKLFTRYPDVRLAVEPGEVQRETSALLRGIIALPVTLHGKEK